MKSILMNPEREEEVIQQSEMGLYKVELYEVGLWIRGKEVNRKIAQSDHKWEKVLEEKVNALREWHGNMIYWKGQGMETKAKVLDLFQRATEKS